MQGFHGGFKSEQNSLYNKQKTGIGQEARTGSLVDTAPIIIVCSNCKKELCEIKVTRPHAKIKSFVVAKCDYCGDKSFKQEIVGGFIIGGTEDSAIAGYPMTTDRDDEYYIQNLTIETRKRRKV